MYANFVLVLPGFPVSSCMFRSIASGTYFDMKVWLYLTVFRSVSGIAVQIQNDVARFLRSVTPSPRRGLQ